MELAYFKKRELPDVPGVYLFTKGKGHAKKVLYVGKATSLRDRVRSYFDNDLIVTRGPRVVDMVTQSDSLSFETVPTVLEALVREAALIRKYMPKANVEGKDDKSFLYVCITDEYIPRVLMIRGKDIDFATKTSNGVSCKNMYGPFPSGAQLKEALRIIRRIFPFYDTKTPIQEWGKHAMAKAEFNRQIGHYPREVDLAMYKKSIRNICLFLDGKTKVLRKTLTKEMHAYAKSEQFEQAAMVRGQLFALDHIQDVSLIKEEWKPTGFEGKRIEAYDVAHISGTNAFGVMTVLEDGRPLKSDYRIFRIRGAVKNDDIASLTEILSRRLNHNEWPLPSAIVVDGGKTHKKRAEKILEEAGVSIPVVAVVKDARHRPREVIGSLRARITDADAVLANAEAHRFSLLHHRKARGKSMRK